MISQTQSLKQLQKLSPQQIQLMKLLQVPTAQLEDRIKEELEINPALEDPKNAESDTAESQIANELIADEREKADEKNETNEKEENDFEMDSYLTDDNLDVPDYKTQGDDYYGSDDDEDKNVIPIATTKSFHEHLEQQLGMLNLDDHTFLLADYLIGSIDDDGYIRRPLESMVDDLAFGQNIVTTHAELLSILKLIQLFEPAGIAARSLQECLLIQLAKKEKKTVIDNLAIEIITKYFDEFTKKHYEKLAKHLDVPDNILKRAIDDIIHLNPKPGSSYSENNKMDYYLIPDFIIVNNEGELILTLNSRNAPELRVSSNFKEMLRDYSKGDKKDKQQKEALQFIKQKIDGAKWFIDAIKQRQHTMLSVMRTLLSLQVEYFRTGDDMNLRPMILKDIADRTGLDISTVSRVANSKFVQTEFGTYSLKTFFSESLTTDSGEEVSTKEVKKILNQIIELEDKKKPFSDEYLTEALNEKGYNIARRTVAKYREQLNIPVARLRKEI
jgi:RNA polymerase sigma-54 factor